MILDTNALSAFAEGDQALDSVLHASAQLSIPVVVLGEYRYGISRSRERRRYEEWLDQSASTFRILDIDRETALSYAAIRTELKRAGTPIPSNDSWIAALCRQHSLPIVSRDHHFDLVPGIQRLSW